MYGDALQPGAVIMRYLAPPEGPGSALVSLAAAASGEPRAAHAAMRRSGLTGPANTTSTLDPRIQLWIPDTLIYGGKTPPMWLSSTREGRVECTTHFSDKRVVSKLGNPQFEEDIVAVRKLTSSQPVSRSVTAASKGNLDPVPHAIVGVGDTGVSSGGSSSACVWRGNQLTVLNTKQVRELAVQAATGGSGEVVVLQKFIKPSGPNPWIQRGVWRKGRAPHAWVITNKAPFGDPDATDIAHRFCTHPHTDLACTLFHASAKAVRGTHDIATRIVHHLERQLCRHIATLVLDCVRDDMGHWWLLQIKAFQLEPIQLPQRVAQRRQLKRRMALHAALESVAVQAAQAADHPESATHTAPDEAARFLASEANAHAKKLSRVATCRFCMLGYPPSKLPYQMTTKMILDTKRRLRARLPPAARSRWLADGHAFRGSGLDTGSLYQALRVCSTCFQLYQQDRKLSKLEQAMASALSPPPATTATAGVHEADGVGDAADPTTRGNLDNMTLCRLFVAMQGLVDLPLATLARHLGEDVGPLVGGDSSGGVGADDPAGDQGVRLFLEYGILGHTARIPVDLAAAEQVIEGGRTVYRVPAPHVAVYPFFSANTELDAPLSPDSGLACFLKQCHSLRVRLTAQRSPRAEVPHVSESKSPNVQPASADVAPRPRRPRPASARARGPVGVNRRPASSEAAVPPQRQQQQQQQRQQRRVHPRSARPAITRPTPPPRHDPPKASPARPRMRRAAQWTVGEAWFPLRQFHSSQVIKLDTHAPLGLSLGMCAVHCTLGLERTRAHVDPGMLTSSPLRAIAGVMVAGDPLASADPLPRDWVQAIPDRDPRRDPYLRDHVRDHVQRLLHPPAQSPPAKSTSPPPPPPRAPRPTKVDSPLSLLGQAVSRAEEALRGAHVSAGGDDPLPRTGAKGSAADAPRLWTLAVHVHAAHHVTVGNSSTASPAWCEHRLPGGIITRTPLSELRTQAGGRVDLTHAGAHALHATSRALHAALSKNDPDWTVQVDLAWGDGASRDAPQLHARIPLSALADTPQAEGTFDAVDSRGEHKVMDGQFHPPYLSASLALSPALDSHGGRDNAPPSPPPGYRTVGVMAPGVKVVEAVE